MWHNITQTSCSIYTDHQVAVYVCTCECWVVPDVRWESIVQWTVITQTEINRLELFGLMGWHHTNFILICYNTLFYLSFRFIYYLFICFPWKQDALFVLLGFCIIIFFLSDFATHIMHWNHDIVSFVIHTNL